MTSTTNTTTANTEHKLVKQKREAKETRRQYIARRQNRIKWFLANMITQHEIIYNKLKELREDAVDRISDSRLYPVSLHRYNAIVDKSREVQKVALELEVLLTEASQPNGLFERHREAYPFLRTQPIRKYEGIEK